MKREKYLPILERMALLTEISLEKVEEAFLLLAHNDKRSLLHDLKRILRNHKGFEKVFGERGTQEFLQQMLAGTAQGRSI